MAKKGTCQADEAFINHSCNLGCNHCDYFKEVELYDYETDDYLKSFDLSRCLLWLLIAITFLTGVSFILYKTFQFIDYLIKL